MLNKIYIPEARCIANLKSHTDYQKKRLIKLFCRIAGHEINIYQIPEDHPDFEKLFENVLNYFRNEGRV